MKLLKEMELNEHENVMYCYDKETGLKAIIAIHDTTLGPALGGTRFWPYENEEEALYDVLRLSKGMSYKNAAAGLNFGGGKAVIIGDPKKLKSKEFFKAYAKFVDRLNGCYYTAEDVNTTLEDMKEINKHTKYVGGLLDNPAPFTALGTYHGLKAGVQAAFNTDSLKGLKIAVSGLGSVGFLLCEYLNNEGATLIVSDIDDTKVEKAVKEFNATKVDTNDIITCECDVFAPCALGAVINTENAKQLKCKVIAGCANNVLVTPEAGDLLEKQNIVYVPDYIINAGGVINVSGELESNYDIDIANQKIKNIYQTVLNIIELAKKDNIPTYKAADRYAQSIIDNKKVI